MKQEQSYQTYRKEIEVLNFKKQKILQAIEQKKQAHVKYREYLKLYNQYDKQQEELTKELIKLI